MCCDVLCYLFFFLMLRRPPRSTRTYTLVPYTTLFRSKLRCIRTVMSEIRDGAGRSFDEVEAVRSWLTAHPRCNGKVGVIGYCMGGGFALVLAPGHGFDDASVNYRPVPQRAYTHDLRAEDRSIGKVGIYTCRTSGSA